MKNNIVRAICLLLSMNFLVFSFTACKDSDKPKGEWKENVRWEEIKEENDTQQNEETQEVSKVDTVATVKNGKIYLGDKGKTRFKIVASFTDEVSYAYAKEIQKAIKKTTDAAVEIISDYDENIKFPEIIIGKTNRKEGTELEASLKSIEYAIKAFKDGTIAIQGGSPLALEMAIDYFLTTYFGYDKEKKTFGTYSPIPANLNFKKSILDGYTNLVWGDDFDGTKLDSSKWVLEDEMPKDELLEHRKDDSAIKLKDGSLHLICGRIDDEHYYTNVSLSTISTMAFTYGYVEMRAKIPFGRPSWPSWWMLSSNLAVRNNYIYNVEVDIFEAFASPNVMKTTVHKWFQDGTSRHEGLPDSQKTPYSFASEEEAEKWHTYALLWTPTSINFLVDGEVAQYINTNDESDFSTLKDGMEGFREPMYLIFNNFIFTKAYSGSETWSKDFVALPEHEFPRDYIIDYLKIYQKTGEGTLITAE